MAGVKEMLLRGEWPTAPPIGYDIIKTNGKRSIVLNRDGKLLKKAFYWKANEKVSSEEIIKRLAAQGLKISNQRISAFFRNPFYCGLMVHTALEGQVIEGNHEKMISKEMFLEVNGLLAERKQGYQVNSEIDDVALKQFYKCESCGRYLRGYKAYKNQKYYYKCNTKGCGCNRKAEELHGKFLNIVSKYCFGVDEETMSLVREQIIAEYNRQNDQKDDTLKVIDEQLSAIDKKLERLEERYVLEEITQEMFQKFKAKFLEERGKIDEQKSKVGIRVSNLEECIDAAFRLAPKLALAWDYADYQTDTYCSFWFFLREYITIEKQMGVEPGK